MAPLTSNIDHSTFPIVSNGGSALDPLVEVVCWRAWRLVGASARSSANGAHVDAARSVFRLLSEQFYIPGRTVMFSQVAFSPAKPGLTDVVFAVGVLGQEAEVAAEAQAVEAVVSAQLGRETLPFSIESIDISAALTLPSTQLHSYSLRQRMVSVDDGDGGEVPVLMRWNPTIDPWVPTMRLLLNHPHWISVRVTVLPTELTVMDRSELDAGLRAADRMRRRGQEQEQVELLGPADRALVTTMDVLASFGSPLMCGELAIVSDHPVAERLVRSIGSCFTSESDVLRRSGHTVVAGQAVMLGGFQVEPGGPLHHEALRLGLPLRGGLEARELRDLWTITEAPIGWPVPTDEPLPGVPSVVRRRRAVPAGLDEGLFIGRGAGGEEVRLPEQVMRRHVSISGRTGCGKTALMVHMAEDDLETGASFLWLDPHQAGCDHLLARSRQLGIDVVVIDPTDGATNRLMFAPRLQRNGENLAEVERAVRQFTGAVVSHLPSDWTGPRFSLGASAHLIPACAHGLEVAQVVELLADKDGVNRLLKHPAIPGWVRDQLLGQFSRTNSDATSVREWVDAKFAPFFTGPARHILAAPGHGVDIGKALMGGTPVLVNLAGLPQHDASTVGHLVLAMAIDAIIARGPVTHDQASVRLYVDEAPRFPVHNLEMLLTGGRKFGAALVLACQSLLQYRDQLSDLVLGADAQLAFTQTPAGAMFVNQMLGIAAEDLVDQPDGHAYVKVAGRTVCSVDTPRYRICPPRPERSPVTSRWPEAPAAFRQRSTEDLSGT